MSKVLVSTLTALLLISACRTRHNSGSGEAATASSNESTVSPTTPKANSQTQLKLATVTLTTSNTCSGIATTAPCTSNGIGMVCTSGNILGTCALTDANKSCSCINSNVEPQFAAQQTCNTSSVTACQLATFGSACSAGAGIVAGFCAPNNGTTCSCAVFTPEAQSMSGQRCSASTFNSDAACTTLSAGQACSTGVAVGVCVIGNNSNAGCSCVTATSAPLIATNVCNSSTFYSSTACASAPDGSACRTSSGSAGVCVPGSSNDGCGCAAWSFGQLPLVNTQTCNSSTFYSAVACTGQTIGAACNSAGQSGVCALSTSNSGCNCVSVPKPPNVSAVNLVNATAGGITVSWPSAGGSATGYKVGFLAGATAPADCATSIDAGASTVTTLSNLNSGQYSVRVCSYDSRGVTSSGTTATFVNQPAPPEVANLTATVNGQASITLNWSSGGGSTVSYAYSLSTSAVPPAQCTGGAVASTTSVTIASLAANTIYKFLVCAVGQFGQTTAGMTTSAKTDPLPPPPAPTNLVVTAVSTSGLNLVWQSGGGSTSGYFVAYTVGAGIPSCSAGVNVNAVNSYGITGLTQGTTYTVAVCPYNADGIFGATASAVQQTISSTAQPPTPTGLVATALTGNSVALSWQSAGGSTAGFYVNYAAGTTAPSCASGVDVNNVTTYNVTGLTSGTSYIFAVCSYNSLHEASSAITVSMTFVQPPPITFISSSGYATSTTAQTVTVNIPSGVQSGDLLVASFVVFSGTAAAPPTGWTLARAYNWTTQPYHSYVYTKTATSIEPASYAFSITGGAQNSARSVTLAYRNAKFAAIGAFAESSASTLVLPGVTGTTSGQIAVGIALDRSAAAVTSTVGTVRYTNATGAAWSGFADELPVVGASSPSLTISRSLVFSGVGVNVIISN